MATAEMRIPGPDHPMRITPNSARVVVALGGKIIADSRDTLTLQEASYPPVHHIPRKDVDMHLLRRTDRGTHCPYKGEASYFSLPEGGTRSVNAVWSYEAPHAAVAAIREYVAFYPSRVDSISEEAAL